MQNDLSTHPVHQCSLFKLRSRSKLASLLKLTDAQLRRLSKNKANYSEWDLPKKDGSGIRHIENPANLLKKTQWNLAKILGRITPPDFLYCPVKGRCYVSNAAQHVGSRVVRTLDIQKFFPNTLSRRVFWFFNKVMKCERDIAGVLTKLTCFNEHLPTGSPLSPIMSFYAHTEMWSEIHDICKENNLILTIYIDDVTVSGQRVPDSVMWDIRKIIHKYGHKYHKEKIFVDRPSEVTGIFISGPNLLLPNRQNKKIRITRALVASSDDEELMKQYSLRLSGLQGQREQIRQKSVKIG